MDRLCVCMRFSVNIMNSTRIYWEKQGSDYLCGLHTLNALFQGPAFTEADLKTYANEISKKEQELLAGEKNLENENNHANSQGYFSWTVIERALKKNGFSAKSIFHEENKHIWMNPQSQRGFIIHIGDHWYALRQIDGVWYDLNSLKAPAVIPNIQNLLVNLRANNATIFVVEGPIFPTADARSSKFDGGSKYKAHYYTKDEILRLSQSEANIKTGDGSSNTMSRPSGGSFFTGQSNRASPLTSAHPVPSQEEDELQRAIRLSLEDFANESAPPAPKAEPVDSSGGVVNIKVAGAVMNSRRKWSRDSTSVSEFFDWIDWFCSSHNLKHNGKHICICDKLSLMSRFPPTTLERVGGRVTPCFLLNGQPIDGETILKDAQITEDCVFMMNCE
eukprot:GDKJ01016830.1.p1 GENE.GDKJ01016830.1~~GDKJ01016830.1.p1  ORF type:complete len:390 (+),score=82.25 GDKJ01016830.1:179-1348(+)